MPRNSSDCDHPRRGDAGFAAARSARMNAHSPGIWSATAGVVTPSSAPATTAEIGRP